MSGDDSMGGEFGPMEAWLICEEQGESRRIDLVRSPMRFGRDAACDETFYHQGISREHFSLTFAEQSWWIKDLNSSNGTLVNGKRIKQQKLSVSDRISIGGSSRLAPVHWTFHATSRETTGPQTPNTSTKPTDKRDHDTQFAFNMAQLEQQASTGVLGLSQLPAYNPNTPSIFGSVKTGVFPATKLGDTLPAPGSAAAKKKNEFDIHGAISLFSQMGQALLHSQDIDQLLDRTLDLIFRNLPAARGSIWLRDDATGENVCRGNRVRGGDGSENVEISMSIANEAIESQQALLVRQVLTDERFQHAASVATLQIRSAMCAPLYHQGEVRGFLYVDSSSQAEEFTNDHLGVLTAMAMFTATGIEKIRSVQQTIATRNHLQSVLESISHLVLTLDREGRLQTINRSPQKQLGIDEQIMRTQQYTEWFPDRNQGFIELLRNVYQTSEPHFISDYELLGEQGQASSVNCTVVPLLDFQQSQTGVVAILEDLTREKRMATALGRYLSPTLAQRVMQEGEARLGGVKQKVTILFSDIRSYTALTEALDAQQVVEMLNAYFTEMVETILAERGFLDKYIGDAIMAVFGVPYTESDDAIRACRSALAMHRALKDFNDRRASVGLLPVRIGVGLSSGDVISGNIGSEKRLEFTCIGDGVNLASRIEGVTKMYEVPTMISQYTHQELGDRFITRELDCVRVMGKQEPIRIYELIAEQLSDLSQPKQDTLELYETGLAHYRRRDWAKAARFFHKAEKLTNDGPSRILFLRCQAFEASPSPPGKNWDATWDLNHK